MSDGALSQDEIDALLRGVDASGLFGNGIVGSGRTSNRNSQQYDPFVDLTEIIRTQESRTQEKKKSEISPPQYSFKRLEKHLHKEVVEEIKENLSEQQRYYGECLRRLLGNQKILKAEVDQLKTENVKLKKLIDDTGLLD